ncbi:hypothetical protein BH18VER1_BH18VER1_18510 [soil metagenome]
MPDLEMEILVGFRRHGPYLSRNALAIAITAGATRIQIQNLFFPSASRVHEPTGAPRDHGPCLQPGRICFIVLSVSKVEQMEAELSRLSQAELRQIRE